MEWVEVEAKSVEAAVQAAVEELGLESAEEAEVEVLQEPQRGFLGMGGQGAIVRVKQAPPKRRRKRGGSGRGKGSSQRKPDGDSTQGGRAQSQRQGRAGQPKGGGDGRKSRPKATTSSSGGGKGGATKGRDNGRKDRNGGKDRKGHPDGGDQRPRRTPKENTVAQSDSSDRPPLDVQEQASVVRSFLEGLVSAFGLEGEVKVEVIDEDIIIADVSGEQTAALVGVKGSILQSVLDLLKIIVQRKTTHRARIRLDIAGYQSRRREALTIYATRLTEKVLSEGGEVMLEPMNPADRKVVHDAVAEIEGTRSWSEGEEPNRSVLIGLAPGVEPTRQGSGDDDGGEDRGEDTADTDADASTDQSESDDDGDIIDHEDSGEGEGDDGEDFEGDDLE